MSGQYEPIKPSEPVNFFAQAYDNYLSARLLLNKRRFIDGHILAQFSIEKYMKGLLLLKGQRFFGHDLTETHWLADFHEMFPTLRAWLSTEFLTYLGNAFRLRYWDNQRDIGNILLFRRKTLMHLDHTVSIVEQDLLRRPLGKESRYAQDVMAQLPDLIDENLVVNSSAQFDRECYEEDIAAYVLDENLNLMELTTTLLDHNYSAGFPSPGHLKFTSRDAEAREHIFPSRTYPRSMQRNQPNA